MTKEKGKRKGGKGRREGILLCNGLIMYCIICIIIRALYIIDKILCSMFNVQYSMYVRFKLNIEIII